MANLIKKNLLFFLRLPTAIINIIVLKRKNVLFGNNLRINGRIHLYGKGKIRIGNNVKINSSLDSNPIGGDTRTIIMSMDDALITIGNNTGISNTAIVSREKIEIGSNVMIGGGTQIFDNDFHSLSIENRISKKDHDISSKPVIIKDGAFIGARCIILKGVTIGSNSVVGAGSVITKSIPDNEVWAGNPAKKIRSL